MRTCPAPWGMSAQEHTFTFCQIFFIYGGNYTLVTCIQYTNMVTHSECEISQSWRTQFSSHGALNLNRAVMPPLPLSVVRPVVEYACPVWHTNLPIYLSDNIEMIQKRAVRAIFPGMSYVDILNHINLSTMKERRDYLCKTYFINMQARSHKVNCLLPKKKACRL